MTTFNTAFKNAYSEALKPYGFVKLKGKYPYFVRLINDEILQVITYQNEWCQRPMHAFNVLCGIATVYRKELDFNISPRNNNMWLDPLYIMYNNRFPNGTSDTMKPKTKFQYLDANEEAMNTIIQNTIYFVKQIVLPVFDEVTDLCSCIDYFCTYPSNIINFAINPNTGEWEEWEHKEDLLHLMVYDNVVEYQKMREKYADYWQRRDKDKLEKGIYTKEYYEKEKNDRQKFVLQQISIFEQFMNEPELYGKAMQLLEERKDINQQKLREYGIINES